MVAQSTLLVTDVVRHEAKPLVGEVHDYDPLLNMTGDARHSSELPNGTLARSRKHFPQGSEKGDYNANKTDSEK